MSDVVGQATRLELLSVADPELLLIDTDGAGEVTAYEATLEVVEVGDTTALIESSEQLSLLEVGTQGPPGAGTGGGGGGVFILDVGGIGGIVGGKTYRPNDIPLATAVSDTATVRVFVGADGGGQAYTPSVTVNGVPAAMAESATKRWFTGYADITLVDGDNTITVMSSEGDTDYALVTKVGAGPDILSVTFGAYPGAQTQLKQGDTIGVTIQTAPEATSVTIQADGASAHEYTWTAVGGVAAGTITISGRTGSQVLYLSARNNLGTEGAGFASPALNLNQTYPTLTAIAVTYPLGQTAFRDGQTGSISVVGGGSDQIGYASPDFAVADPTTYAEVKPVTCLNAGYVGSGENITVTAVRHANGATTIRTGLARVASVPPTAAISIAGNPARLASSPAGTTYEVRITPSQTLGAAPTLSASLGAWSGSWTQVGSYWRRNLLVNDAVPRGAGLFSNLSLTGMSNYPGDEITSGATYTVGGLSSRTLTVPAFSRTAALGANVGDATKTTASIVGGAALVRQTSAAVVQGGYYIADLSGVYNPTGAYLALSDTAFAGANTTGTLQITFAEAP